ncbi:MAG TPA: hypothetical protein H9783_05245 [Candidatus Limosilactobacillus faecipullorum]|nr:hypothetical protein [Candidatus Limosilactobacillus faecipullorum]
MQNVSRSSLRERTLNMISHLKPIFSEPFFADQPPVTLLPIEPLFQRKLFLKKAIESQREVFLQLMPTTDGGQPINVRGVVRKLDDQRYLLAKENKTYFFKINQLRYIAG